jgi:hypothetical protein
VAWPEVSAADEVPSLEPVMPVDASLLAVEST